MLELQSIKAQSDQYHDRNCSREDKKKNGLVHLLFFLQNWILLYQNQLMLKFLHHWYNTVDLHRYSYTANRLHLSIDWLMPLHFRSKTNWYTWANSTTLVLSWIPAEWNQRLVFGSFLKLTHYSKRNHRKSSMEGELEFVELVLVRVY